MQEPLTDDFNQVSHIRDRVKSNISDATGRKSPMEAEIALHDLEFMAWAARTCNFTNGTATSLNTYIQNACVELSKSINLVQSATCGCLQSEYGLGFQHLADFARSVPNDEGKPLADYLDGIQG